MTLTRQQRRHIERQLRKLLRRNVCSICGSPFRHNSRTAGGLDTHGNVVLAGECCIGRVAEIFVMGLYSDRQYDFLPPRSSDEPGAADAIATYQEIIADTDRRLARIERRGGRFPRAPDVYRLDYPWKSDDRAWFERTGTRAHRARMPFPGEVDDEATAAPAGQALVVLVQHVEPGSWVRTGLYLDTRLLPVPDDEATIHALFEMAMRREPMPPDVAALIALIEKYSVCTGVES